MDGNRATGPFGQTIRQVREATFRQLCLPAPALILVDAGEKRIGRAGRITAALPGQILLLPEDEPLAVTNLPPEGGHYRARVIPIERERVETAYERLQIARRPSAGAVQAVAPGARSRETFETLFAMGDALPSAIRALRVEELLLWLAEDGALLPLAPPPSITQRLRNLMAPDPGSEWTAGRAAKALAMSEATLRRRLRAESASFAALLVDLRMAQALSLLQGTDLPVGAVAAAVGYDSPSRFAVRFRARFGLSPREIRA
ncbi:helix-turn-helix transcriptional regulator [Frigidibacter sp. RF13]|uniref:helix-turn-helix transcriptional regulator n=1 Tax=Frigidibacter sp. RF13 TaxID=2997340 RepID=UPI002271E65B|nr:AraC family transcriptional regulator [Frigidibacter sp. RF13]MCY1126597.1 helix-turn-helix transcriptional regulator [Frigidibacter sp. RF13]